MTRDWEGGLVLIHYKKKYPNSSPYLGFGGNPILFTDKDGRDIVYFGRDGNEIQRIKSNTIFEAYVQNVGSYESVHNIVLNPSSDFFKERLELDYTKASMPDIISEKLSSKKEKDGSWKIEKGLDAKKYQKYDYQIAASTLLFNQEKNNGAQFYTDGGLKIPTEITSKVSDVSPTAVKELMMQESEMGTNSVDDKIYHSKKDIMQVNNGVNNFQDFAPYKSHYGLSKGTIPGPLLSITAGLKDFLTKGFHGSKISTDKKGNITNIEFRGWLIAGKNYNGGGVPNYLESLKHMQAHERKPKASDY